MDRYTVIAPESLTVADNAGRVECYLQAQGIETAGVVVRWDADHPTAIVTVTADTDPTVAMASYVPTLTPDEQERADTLADAQAAIDAITATPREERTDSEKLLLALAIGSDAVTAAVDQSRATAAIDQSRGSE